MTFHPLKTQTFTFPAHSLGVLRERYHDQPTYVALGQKMKVAFGFSSKAEDVPVFMESHHLCVCIEVFI